MVRYFESLTEKEQWQCFLEYRQVTNQLIYESYFIDQLKWILKHSSINLEYDLYVQAMLDPDFSEDDVKFDELDKRYGQRFKKISALCLDSEPPASSLDRQEDTLPF